MWETLRIAAEALLNGDLELCSTVIDVCAVVHTKRPLRLLTPMPGFVASARGRHQLSPPPSHPPPLIVPLCAPHGSQAGDIRAVDGSLELCYDSTGVMYQLPRFIFSTPRNLVSAADAVLPKRSGHRGPVVSIPVTIRLSASVRLGQGWAFGGPWLCTCRCTGGGGCLVCSPSWVRRR